MLNKSGQQCPFLFFDNLLYTIYMSKVRVGVLRGGPSNEYEVSLKTGATVLAHLPEEKYETRDIFIDRQGTWHMRGRPLYPEQALEQVDVAFNALHGHYGEDGQVQHLLEQLAIPFTGSGSLGSAVAMNKLLTKERVKKADIKTAFHVVLTPDRPIESIARDVFRSFPSPWVIKPASSGSSVGVTLARSFEELVEGINEAFGHSEKVFIEDYVRGREATVGVIEGFRDEDAYALPPIEIIPAPERTFFDYHAKYAGASQEICPGNFTMEEKRELERLAKLVHRELGLRHYSRSDFIINPTGIYFLEVNTLPGLTQESLVPKAVGAVGSGLPEFLDHLVTLALKQK